MLSPVLAGSLPVLTLPAGATAIPGQYIVLLKEDATVSVRDLLAQQHLPALHTFERVKGFTAILDASALDRLRKNAHVALVEQDQMVWAFRTPAQTTPTGVDRAEADLSATAQIDKIDRRVDADIAIVDTGVDARHPDLNVVSSVNFSSDLSSSDRNGHGSHVAGTAAALDNGIGAVGVAPGARIWSVKVLDRRGSGSMSAIIRGVDYITSKASQIEVANMSLGCNCASAALDAAISRSVAAGVVYAVAAGNDGRDATTYSPANHPQVITVSAVADFNGLPGGGATSTCYADKDDTFANFSNFGGPVDIAAPGVCIFSTWQSGDYATISGTSMASPHVAGAVALYLSSRSKPVDAAGVADVRDALVLAGTSQSAADGFTEDRDLFSEPLLNVSGL